MDKLYEDILKSQYGYRERNRVLKINASRLFLGISTVCSVLMAVTMVVLISQ